MPVHYTLISVMKGDIVCCGGKGGGDLDLRPGKTTENLNEKNDLLRADANSAINQTEGDGKTPQRGSLVPAPAKTDCVRSGLIFDVGTDLSVIYGKLLRKGREPRGSRHPREEPEGMRSPPNGLNGRACAQIPGVSPLRKGGAFSFYGDFHPSGNYSRPFSSGKI